MGAFHAAFGAMPAPADVRTGTAVNHTTGTLVVSDGGGDSVWTEQEKDEVLLKLALIGSGAAPFINSSVLIGGKIVLYQGFDRVSDAGNPLAITDADGTNLPDVGAALKIEAVHTGDKTHYFDANGAVVAGGGSAKIAQFDVPRTAHADRRTGQYKYFLWELVGGTWNKLQVAGTLTLEPGLVNSAA